MVIGGVAEDSRVTLREGATGRGKEADELRHVPGPRQCVQRFILAKIQSDTQSIASLADN